MLPWNYLKGLFVSRDAEAFSETTVASVLEIVFTNPFLERPMERGYPCLFTVMYYHTNIILGEAKSHFLEYLAAVHYFLFFILSKYGWFSCNAL